MKKLVDKLRQALDPQLPTDEEQAARQRSDDELVALFKRLAEPRPDGTPPPESAKPVDVSTFDKDCRWLYEKFVQMAARPTMDEPTPVANVQPTQTTEPPQRPAPDGRRMRLVRHDVAEDVESQARAESRNSDGWIDLGPAPGGGRLVQIADDSSSQAYWRRKLPARLIDR